MALKLKITKDELSNLDDNIKTLYKIGNDGMYHLDTEEDVETKKKIAEFRENNIKLMKEKEEYEKKYKDIDPDKYKEYMKKMQDLEDKKLIEGGKIDELVNQKVERMKKTYENQIEEMKKALNNKDLELSKTNERLLEAFLESEIAKSVTSIGSVRKGAIEDIMARSKKIWKLDNGKPVPKDGDKILYGMDKNTLS